MKRPLLILVAVLLIHGMAVAQAPPPAAPSGQKTLAATMNVYVFPTKGQTPDVQSQDEADCYGWAVQNTGVDPFQLAKQAEQQKQQADKSVQATKSATEGAGAKGAVGGAAAGALIGAIAGDAGKGAAIGAGAGLIAGRAAKRGAESNAQAQAQQQTQQMQQYTKEQTENFRKAFSVCLEAKEYMVKF